MSNEPGPLAVVITAREMYDTILETRDDVKRLATLVEPVTRDHEARLRVLEKRVWLIGALAVGGGATLSQVVSAFMAG